MKEPKTDVSPMVITPRSLYSYHHSLLGGLLSLLFFSIPSIKGVAYAEPQGSQVSAGAFARSRVQISLGGGSNHLAGVNYLLIRGQVSYFMLDGVSADLGIGSWIPLGDGPPLFQVTPGVSYFLYQLRPIVPYVGGFYEHTFTSLALEHPNAVGGRAGLIYSQGSSLIGGGVRVTRALSCREDCELITPELILQFSF